MSNLPECPAQRCIDLHKKYPKGGHIHVGGVHPVNYDGKIARCESCGSYFDGKSWTCKCATCGKDVAPGELNGLFVPRHCHECDAKKTADQKARGLVCSTCRNVISYCYC